MRQEAPLDSGLAGFFAFMGELTCHWRSLVYTKAMKSETINQEEAMNTIETTAKEQLENLAHLYTADDYLAGATMQLEEGYRLEGRSNRSFAPCSFNIIGPDGEPIGMSADVYGPRLGWRSTLDEEVTIEEAYVQWAAYGRETSAAEARAFARAVLVAAGYVDELNRRAAALRPALATELKAEREERHDRYERNKAEWDRREVQAHPHLGERVRITYADGKRATGTLACKDDGLACHLDDENYWTAAGNPRDEAQRLTRIDWYYAVKFEVMEPNGRYGTVLEFEKHDCN